MGKMFIFVVAYISMINDIGSLSRDTHKGS